MAKKKTVSPVTGTEFGHAGRLATQHSGRQMYHAPTITGKKKSISKAQQSALTHSQAEREMAEGAWIWQTDKGMVPPPPAGSGRRVKPWLANNPRISNPSPEMKAKPEAYKHLYRNPSGKYGEENRQALAQRGRNRYHAGGDYDEVVPLNKPRKTIKENFGKKKMKKSPYGHHEG